MIEWLKPSEAAERLGILPDKLRRWGREGRIARKMDSRATYLYAVADGSPVAAEEERHDKTRMVVGLFDVHVPDHDRALWDSCLQFIKERKPDEVIIGGDFLELASCSQHGGDPEAPSLAEDLRYGRRAIKQLMAAAGDAKITYIEGNHETRLQRSVASFHPNIHGVISIPEQLGLFDLGIDWVPEEEQPIARGHLHFLHGHYTNKHHAAKHVLEYGASVTYGHTHVPQVFMTSDVSRTVHGAYGMPCMRSLDPSWMRGRPSNWTNGFGVYYVRPDGNFNAYQVLAFDGVFTFEGKTYGR